MKATWMLGASSCMDASAICCCALPPLSHHRRLGRPACMCAMLKFSFNQGSSDHWCRDGDVPCNCDQQLRQAGLHCVRFAARRPSASVPVPNRSVEARKQQARKQGLMVDAAVRCSEYHIPHPAGATTALPVNTTAPTAGVRRQLAALVAHHSALLWPCRQCSHLLRGFQVTSTHP